LRAEVFIVATILLAFEPSSLPVPLDLKGRSLLLAGVISTAKPLFGVKMTLLLPKVLPY
jgi:hypothetical protein